LILLEGVAIGRRLAEQLSIRVGDKMTLIAPGGPSTPFGNAPRRKSYPVLAVFEIGMSEFDSTFVYLPLKEAQAYFDKDDEATVIEIFLQNADKVDQIKPALEAAITRPHILSSA
jgi:lipoprotein-releasing system permease protein